MTALPRNPVEVSAAALQSQNTAAGRAAPNRAQPFGSGEAEGDSILQFAALVGNADGMVSPPANKSDVANRGVRRELHPLGQGTNLLVERATDQLSGEVGLPAAPITPANTNDATTLWQTVTGEPRQTSHGEGLHHTGTIALSGVSASALSLTGKISGESAVANGAKPQAVVPGGQPTEASVLSQQPRTQEQKASRLVEPALQEIAAAKNDLGHGNPVGKVEQTVAVRSDLAIVRGDRAAVSNDKPPARPNLLNTQSSEVEPSRLDVPRNVSQARATPVQADFAGLPVQSPDSVSVSANAASNAASLSLNGSDDEPRLQDVKILGSRVNELPPGAADRSGQGTTVKVIDLQLQPETLGRIGAQLKQTAGGLEVRLEPSMAETALLLKEDKLALQRILGAIGSLSDPAVVRIVDPIADQRQADGQEALADSDLSEAGQSGGHAATSGDLYGEGYSNDSSQNPQTVAEQDSPDSSRQRAADDIYI